MNKKKLLVFGLVGMFAVCLVSAIGYYALFSASFNVLPSITISECNDDLVDVYTGDTIVGKPCTITNVALTERELVISNDAIPEIEVSYLGTLDLKLKDTSTWALIGEPITIGYTIIGDTFEVTGVEEGYTAIYYKDNVVGLEGRLANPQPAISIVGTGNLPHINDANIDELTNYCAEPDFYNQCKGAKIWVVPNGDLSEGTLNWANMANYYYELDLIQYNLEGQIVLSPGASLTVTPVYDIAVGVTGTHTITTTIA